MTGNTSRRTRDGHRRHREEAETEHEWQLAFFLPTAVCNLFMGDFALIEPFRNSEYIRKKKTSASTFTCTRTTFSGADKSTSRAIFPRQSLPKFTLIFHLLFLLSSRTTSCRENSHHQAISNKNLFTLSADGSVLDFRKCKRLREGTSPGKMTQSARFQQTGETKKTPDDA